MMPFHTDQLLAGFLDPGTLALMIPIIALIIPIVGMLIKHQQKMAELMHSGQKDNQMNVALLHELQTLRAEVASLKETVHQQAIALDDVRPLGSGEIQNRIGNENG